MGRVGLAHFAIVLRLVSAHVHGILKSCLKVRPDAHTIVNLDALAVKDKVAHTTQTHRERE
jgi:hypothetical protein